MVTTKKKSSKKIVRKSSAAPKKKGRSKPAKRSGTSGVWKAKALRYGLFAVLICGVLGLLGSAYMQVRIAGLLRERALNSFAVVVSRPYALAPGVNPHAGNIAQRLKRLTYTRVDSAPQQPGQYRLSAGEIEIYLRESVNQNGQRQPAQRVALELGPDKRISRVRQLERNSTVPVAWLEPEVLSLLGSTERRAVTPTTLSQVSPWLTKALIAIEDERFYQHLGIDPIGIARAIKINLQSGRLRQGGSTLTQQLAKNLFYGNERTLQRKVKEAIAAILIETAFSKDEILEMYLNEVFLGQEGKVAIHGFGEAALAFFGRPVAELTLAQAALLAGIIKAPSAYAPRKHPRRAQQRRDTVLDKMYELGVIDQSQWQQAKDEPLQIQQAHRSVRRAPYHVDYLRAILRDAAPIDTLAVQPIQVHTGIDAEYQRCAEKAVSEGLTTLEKTFPALKRRGNPLQGALVSVVPSTGEFLAWVGGRSYGQNQFDRVSLAARQTGSAFKPIVYLTALDGGLNEYRIARTTSLLVDEPVRLEQVRGQTWEPKNYDKKFRGDVTLREALVHSLNIPAVQLIQKVGVRSVVTTTQQLGISRTLPQVPALALGAAELTPLELTRAYATIANGGRLSQFRPIVAITKNTQAPKVLFESSIRETQQVSEAASFVLTDMLNSAIDHGTGRAVRTTGYAGPVAGKTGTTNDARDTWFVGYTPHLLSVVWVGFDDNAKTGLTGGRAAAPIWSAYMQCVKGMEPALDFVAPPSVVYRDIDYRTGALATKNCPQSNRVTEIFVAGTEPTHSCSEHPERSLFDFDSSDEPTRARIQREDPPATRGKRFFDSLLENIWN